jgi:hypothetical protein
MNKNNKKYWLISGIIDEYKNTFYANFLLFVIYFWCGNTIKKSETRYPSAVTSLMDETY